MRVFQPVGLAIYPSRLAVLRGMTHKCPSSPLSALKLQNLHNMCSCHCLQGQVVAWCASGRMQFLSTETSNSTTCKLMQIHDPSEVTYILCTSPCYYWRAAGFLSVVPAGDACTPYSTCNRWSRGSPCAHTGMRGWLLELCGGRPYKGFLHCQ